MNKTWIIIQREFINRVSKKSFILLTILMPFVFAALILFPCGCLPSREATRNRWPSLMKR